MGREMLMGVGREDFLISIGLVCLRLEAMIVQLRWVGKLGLGFASGLDGLY